MKLKDQKISEIVYGIMAEYIFEHKVLKRVERWENLTPNQQLYVFKATRTIIEDSGDSYNRKLIRESWLYIQLSRGWLHSIYDVSCSEPESGSYAFTHLTPAQAILQPMFEKMVLALSVDF